MKVQLEIKTSKGSSSFVYFDSDSPSEFDPTSLIVDHVDRYNERNQSRLFFTPLKYPNTVKAKEWGDREVKRGGWKGSFEKNFMRAKYQSGRVEEKVWYNLKKAA